jgi:hypothetical protein
MMNAAIKGRSLKSRVMFAFLMSLITTSVVVFVTVWSQLGWSEAFFEKWLSIFSIDYPVVVLMVLFFGPRLQQRFFIFKAGSPHPTKASLLRFALVMASLTVSAACFVGLLLNLGLSSQLVHSFIQVFPFAYLTAIPFILLLAPRLQARVDQWLN